jgi:drug/metabolite transporter (DMT)-like permease
LPGREPWLIGIALLIPGWILQAMALDRGRVAVIQPIFQQIALQTARLAPAVATGSVANPLVGVLLGLALLEERLAPPTWHKVLAFAALGCALAAAVAISLSEERERHARPSREKSRTDARTDASGADRAGRLPPQEATA